MSVSDSSDQPLLGQALYDLICGASVRLASYAGLGFNGRGITMATMMGRLLARAIRRERGGVPIQPLRKVRLHALYPVGVAARIACGQARDVIDVMLKERAAKQTTARLSGND